MSSPAIVPAPKAIVLPSGDHAGPSSSNHSESFQRGDDALARPVHVRHHELDFGSQRTKATRRPSGEIETLPAPLPTVRDHFLRRAADGRHAVERRTVTRPVVKM